MKPSESDVRIHHTSDVSTESILGAGTVIWHQSQIRERTCLGRNCIVGKGVYIDFDVVIGSNVKIQNYASIYHGTILEDGVFVGPQVVFTNDLTPRAVNPDGTRKSDDDWEALGTTVQYGASIGAGAIVLPGLSIGKFALVGAGSVVTRDVPAQGIVVGNPARVIGWACVCGARLLVGNDQGKCTKCSRRYDMDNMKETSYEQTKEPL
jgi:acetyltransferase-like isoleucine patch superfamily enzyme